MKLRFKDQRGISLIEVMVVLGVSGIIVTGVAKFLTGQMKARQAIGSRNDVSAARRAITELFSCEKSLNVAPGTKIETCGDYPMIDKRGNALVGKSGQFGSSPVFLKMRCDDQGMGIAFDYQLGKVVSGAVTALPDPSNGNKAVSLSCCRVKLSASNTSVLSRAVELLSPRRRPLPPRQPFLV